MKTVILVASALACALSLDAQIATTLNRLPDGSTEIRIRNNSDVSLTAFALSANVVGVGQAAFTATHAPLVAYYDPAVGPAPEPLLPNQERALPPTKIMCIMPSRNLSLALTSSDFCELAQPIVTAGIFADGSTTGDAALLSRLMLRRSNLLLAVETTLETLTDAGRRNVPRDQLIERFQRMADSARRWYIPVEQQVAGGVYQAIVGKLVNLPEGQLRSPFLPAAFVAQQTAMLNRQRVTLLESQPSLAEAAGSTFR
jgi:hypothetical protein